VARIANRWAPPEENDTGAYARALANAVGVKVGEHVDWKNEPAKLRDLVKAIIKHENGVQPYSDETIRRALVAAGWEQEPATIAASARRAAPAVATGTAIGAVSVAQVLPHLPATLSALERLPTLVAVAVVVALAAGAVAFIIWRGLKAKP
jgi:hypothetical protein